MTGQELKTKRRLLNFSQGQLAKVLGVAQAMISQVENGRRPLPPARARQLARIFGRPAIVSRDEPRP